MRIGPTILNHARAMAFAAIELNVWPAGATANGLSMNCVIESDRVGVAWRLAIRGTQSGEFGMAMLERADVSRPHRGSAGDELELCVTRGAGPVARGGECDSPPALGIDRLPRRDYRWHGV